MNRLFSLFDNFWIDMNTFYEFIEEANKLSLDEQESIVEILQKRIAEEKRSRFVKESLESVKEFEAGNKSTSSVDEIMKEIVS